MTIDLEMAEIAKIFFQESREGLDVMESGLLSLGGGTADSENINTIFRAAHSIKGGSATFGFGEVADFTHGVETLLDEMRNGVRPVFAEMEARVPQYGAWVFDWWTSWILLGRAFGWTAGPWRG